MTAAQQEHAHAVDALAAVKLNLDLGMAELARNKAAQDQHAAAFDQRERDIAEHEVALSRTGAAVAKILHTAA